MDIIMNYIEKGTGFPLIMIHGNEDRCEYFEHQIKHFSGRYRCLALDSRAHGKTPRGTKSLTIRQMAQDVVDWMDEMDIEQADFIGFSDGGNIMLILAMTHPERIRKMVVDGANLDLSGVADGAVKWVNDEYNAALAKADSDPAMKIKAEIIGLMVHDPNINADDLTKINVPTLVMAGTEDLILAEHTELIASKIPGAELCFIDGDHFCAAGNPKAFNAAVEKFLIQ